MALAVAVVGNRAYLGADSCGLHIVNISDPARPIRVGGYNNQLCVAEWV